MLLCGQWNLFSDLLTIREYYALVSIICNDFPYEILQKTARIVLIDDAHDCLIAFIDFVYSFQLQLYYQGRWMSLANGSLLYYAI